MTLTLYFGFYEPWSGVWVSGERDFWVDGEKDSQDIEDRYTTYFKDTYGDSAEVIRLALKEDED